MDLTKRQQQVLDFIHTCQEREGVVPTVREICAHFGLKGPAGVHRILQILIEKGYLSRAEGKKRSWRLVNRPSRRTIPIVGKIAAGTPISAIENREENIGIAPEAFGCDTCFALQVEGDSMIEAHIADGDLAIIRPQDIAENGQIVAVIIDDLLPEATLKVLQKKKNTIELLPANSAYDPIILKGAARKKISIVGKLVGVVRRNF